MQRIRMSRQVIDELLLLCKNDQAAECDSARSILLLPEIAAAHLCDGDLRQDQYELDVSKFVVLTSNLAVLNTLLDSDFNLAENAALVELVVQTAKAHGKTPQVNSHHPYVFGDYMSVPVQRSIPHSLFLPLWCEMPPFEAIMQQVMPTLHVTSLAHAAGVLKDYQPRATELFFECVEFASPLGATSLDMKATFNKSQVAELAHEAERTISTFVAKSPLLPGLVPAVTPWPKIRELLVHFNDPKWLEQGLAAAAVSLVVAHAWVKQLLPHVNVAETLERDRVAITANQDGGLTLVGTHETQ